MKNCTLRPQRLGGGVLFPGPLVDESVQLAGVLADDLVANFCGQVAQLTLDEFARIGPHAVRVREVRTPHDGIVPNVVEEFDADAITLVGRPALATPVLARPHSQANVLELVLPLRIHAVQHVRDPTNPALANDDLDVAVSLKHAGEDHRYQGRGYI